jgi:hypothetical protein
MTLDSVSVGNTGTHGDCLSPRGATTEVDSKS